MRRPAPALFEFALFWLGNPELLQLLAFQKRMKTIIDARGTNYAAHLRGAAVLGKDNESNASSGSVTSGSSSVATSCGDTALGAASAGEARFQTVVLKILCACGVQNLGQKRF